MKKFLLVTLIVFLTATVLAAFVGCNGGKADVSLASGVYLDGAKVTEFTKDGDTYFAKVKADKTTSFAVVDGDGKSHTVTVEASADEYTVVAVKESGSYKVEAWRKKRAVVWVAALLAGGFYDPNYPEIDDDGNDIVVGKAIWDPLPYDDVKLIDYINPDKMMEAIGKLVPKLIPLLDDLLYPVLEMREDKTNLIWNLSLNGKGEPNNPDMIPANGVDSRVKYGVLSAYRDHAENLAERLEGTDTDAVVFNYDWRMDNRQSVNALQKFIYDNKYTDVVMFSHSLGGNIVAGYLAQNSLNRSVVKRYVSFGGAFLGSFDALFAIENTMDYLMAVVANMGMDIEALTGSLPIDVNSFLKDYDIDAVLKALQDMLVNMYSFPQLVPTFDLISGKQYGENGDGVAITVDGKAITTEEELYAFYETRPWAWQRDEDNEYVYDSNGKHVIRQVVKELKQYHDSLYVYNADGSRTFSTKLVDTYYVTGANILTFCGADYVGEGEDATLEYRTTMNGDKQVLLYSTLVNQDPEEIEEGKYIRIEGKDHFQVGCDYELVGDIIMNAVDEVFFPNE
ncbi:MAG: hypothetical protein IJS93_00705 [Clostridia bacterium]|nr:hypothetical protein [Clostridia bacterium]